MYQEIFKQGKIGNITLKNRLVMSPMGTSLAEMDGSPDRKSTRLNSSHNRESRMPSSA